MGSVNMHFKSWMRSHGSSLTALWTWQFAIVRPSGGTVCLRSTKNGSIHYSVIWYSSRMSIEEMDSAKQRLASVQAVLIEHKNVWHSGDAAMKPDNLALCDTRALFQRQIVSTLVLAREIIPTSMKTNTERVEESTNHFIFRLITLMVRQSHYNSE